MTVGSILLTIGLVFGISALIIIILDIYLAIRYGVASTLSWQLYLASKDSPAIAMAFGLAAGLLLAHLFWNQAGTGCP